jgi:hypothetical protein
MKKKNITPKNNTSNFFSFIIEREQKKDVLFILILYTIAFILMKYLYPYPDGISDSGGYVAAAIREGYDGYRPFGYSRFLMIIHNFSSSISLLVFVQYFINVIASIYFILSLKYFFASNNKFLYYGSLVVALGSILTIYLTNSVLSDSLFSSLTIFWVTFNIWFLSDQKLSIRIGLLILIFITLYFLVNLRYTGIIYFVLELFLILFVLFRQNKILALLSSLVLFLIIYNFYKKQVEVTKKFTRIETFSGFSGWQSANNALHVVPYIEFDKEKIKNESFAEFALYAKSVDTLLVVERTSADFMWDKELPLKKYLFSTIKKYDWKYQKAYTYLGKNEYGEFGKYVMLHYPWEYFRYFLLPNSIGLFYPKGDQLYRSYNPNAISPELLEKWFEIKPDIKLYSRSKLIEKTSVSFATIQLIIWILVFFSIGLLILKKIWNYLSPEKLFALIFIVAFLLIYTAFHIYATPFEIRYIVPVHLIQIALIYIALNESLQQKTKVSRPEIGLHK